MPYAVPLMTYPAENVRALGILPLGTATILPPQPEYRRIKPKPCFFKGKPVAIDIGCINESHYFINMATGGFGPKITTDTPKPLKSHLRRCCIFYPRPDTQRFAESGSLYYQL